MKVNFRVEGLGGFPKLGIPFLGGPHNKDYLFWEITVQASGFRVYPRPPDLIQHCPTVHIKDSGENGKCKGN